MRKEYKVRLDGRTCTRKVLVYERSVYTDCSPEKIRKNEERVVSSFFRKKGPYEQDFVSVRLTSYGAEALKDLITEEGISDLMDMQVESGTFQDVLDDAPLYSGTKVKIRIEDEETGMVKILYPVIFVKESEGDKTNLPEFRVLALDAPRTRYEF